MKKYFINIIRISICIGLLLGAAKWGQRNITTTEEVAEPPRRDWCSTSCHLASTNFVWRDTNRDQLHENEQPEDAARILCNT